MVFTASACQKTPAEVFDTLVDSQKRVQISSICSRRRTWVR